MSSLPPNPRQGFAGLSATGTLTDPNQDPSFITPPGTGGFDEVALLKAKLDDAEKKIQQIQDKGTMVVCAPSQRSIKDRQNQEVKNIVRTIIQTEIWNEVKFVCKTLTLTIAGNTCPRFGNTGARRSTTLELQVRIFTLLK